MDTQSVFKDIHKGEEIICIGNGPGLKNIPPAFLESRINIGINYILEYMKFLKLFYWLTLDKECLDVMPSEPYSFAPMRYMGIIEKAHIPMILYDEVSGVPYSPTYGSSYTTSLAAAIHLATFMGASTAFVVGFDCTFPEEPLEIPSDGISNLPHFYGHRGNGKSVYMPEWDYEMQQVAIFARKSGTKVIDLSIPKGSLCLPHDDYQKYWRPNG